MPLLQAHVSVGVAHNLNCEIQSDMETTAVDTLAAYSTSRPRRWLEASVRFPRQRPLGGIGAGIITIMILSAGRPDGCPFRSLVDGLYPPPRRARVTAHVRNRPFR